jgi:hypothetical protein
MKPLTLTESIDHFEFACRAAILIIGGFIMGFLIEFFVSDREACDE